jgi:hypothetical protein
MPLRVTAVFSEARRFNEVEVATDGENPNSSV